VLAGAFLWLRPRAARLADRIVFGGRATPYEVLTEFSDRVGETYAADDVLPRMASVLGEGTGAATATVWLQLDGRLRPDATWPPDAEVPSSPPPDSVDVTHRGERLGALSVTMPPDDPMDPSKERLLRDLGAQAGLVLRNVRLIEELRASRQRLVAAQDDERRKLERDIHDGVQQQLVALNVQLGLLATIAARDPERAATIATDLQATASATLEDLRDLARGIYPPLLADQGLEAAIGAQARKAVVPTAVEASGVGRYGHEVEAAVYFSVLEAMNNVAKYAHAKTTTISLAQRNGSLEFHVVDDGRGFDPATTERGTGLQGISDRVDAIGGEVRVESAPGAGTTVSGSVPVDGA
jgi:signal transduction histidine kinase